MIRIQNLHKYFNKGRQNELHVINDVSLELPESGMVAIFGKSGCGKTTLLNVIGGLDGFASGEIMLDGQSIKQGTDELRNRYVGYIFQNYNLNKSQSCFENVADALRLCGMRDPDEIESRVTSALVSVGMEKYARRTPDTLSGGQQQRIAIARAIVKNPRIILADEPTGNLDEANTVMIMDLLKAIAKDHLVLLVTHEANLVDYYCDRVIELSDGRVISTKENSAANGFAARDKNDIYLGELAHHVLDDGNVQIDYYGDTPASPIKLRIVSSNGKLYLQTQSDRLQILDATSEVKLREGVFVEKTRHEAIEERINLSPLPTPAGKHYGRLFSFGSSLISGYKANFKDNRKGKKLLRGCMCLFAAVIVLMSAIFGTAFGEIIDAGNAHNHNVFYLYTPDAEVSARLNAAVGDAESGIDAIYLSPHHPRGDGIVTFRTGSFETFTQNFYESGFRTNAVLLDASLAKDMELVEGRREGLGERDLLITTRVADALLETSTLGYISEREDLIGLISSNINVDGVSTRIAGIVECDEPAVYLTSTALAKQTLTYGNLMVSLASDCDVEVERGETVLAIRYYRQGVKYPSVGETVTVNGVSVKVKEIMNFCYDYADWARERGISLPDEYDWLAARVKEKNPALEPGSIDFQKAVDAEQDAHHFDYLDAYYAHFDDFMREFLFFEPQNVDVWLYLEKHVEEAKYLFLPEEYYKANAYRALYGAYPTAAELKDAYGRLPDYQDAYEGALETYMDEFYSTTHPSAIDVNAYLLSDADYVAVSRQLGATHPSAMRGGEDVYYEKEIDAASYGVDAAKSVVMDYDVMGGFYYTVIHSTDPELTDAYLRSEFADLIAEHENDYLLVLLSPDGVFDQLLSENAESIVISLVTLGLMLVLMSICMYFIMRSSLLSRIKEVGIYRAIGVSRKNLVFKFFVEALVLTSLTVLIGYLCTSAFLFFCLGISSMVSQIFYYPLWLAGAVLGILYLLGLFFGVLPILSLLRKTPSEILAKYDI